jgi:hypothetical protein
VNKMEPRVDCVMLFDSYSEDKKGTLSFTNPIFNFVSTELPEKLEFVVYFSVDDLNIGQTYSFRVDLQDPLGEIVHTELDDVIGETDHPDISPGLITMMTLELNDIKKFGKYTFKVFIDQKNVCEHSFSILKRVDSV